jgi:hypothetical protein
LRSPRKSDENYRQWRKDAPVRPIVFEDPGVLDDSVVHLHLEHRVAQRLLGRFLAQGFTAHDLARACFSQSGDSIPRVVLLGRIALFGPNAARLHEEIISVTARWIDPSDRKSPLKLYASEAERKTLEILESSFVSANLATVPDKVVQRLKMSVEQDVSELLEHLNMRANSIRDDAIAELRKRAVRESEEMRLILEAQKKQIEMEISKTGHQQSLFIMEGLAPLEARQLELDRKHWQKRLGALQAEINEEPKRIADGYEVKASRIEPVGIVYLWPRTG